MNIFPRWRVNKGKQEMLHGPELNRLKEIVDQLPMSQDDFTALSFSTGVLVADSVDDEYRGRGYGYMNCNQQEYRFGLPYLVSRHGSLWQGLATPTVEITPPTNCRNCGAPPKVGVVKCEYCDTRF